MSQNSIIIVGGGIVGLTLALALAKYEIKTIIIEKTSPLLAWPENQWDARVSALNQASQRILENLGVMPLIRSQYYSTLKKMMVWESVNNSSISFDSLEMGNHNLGIIIENRELQRVLWEQAQANAFIKIYSPFNPVSLQRKKNTVEITLENNQLLQTSLLIAADGLNSWVKEALGEFHSVPYHQAALIAIIQAEKSHEQTARQVFLPSGPLALLPLADTFHSALIWTLNLNALSTLKHLNNNALACEIINHVGGALGDIHLVNEKKIIPLKKHHLPHYVDSRIVFIGDAAHSIHPLAGQGANLGLMDAACLADCLIKSLKKGKPFDDINTLRHFERWRKWDNQRMLMIMNGLNFLFSNDIPIVANIRSQGLNLFNRFKFIKKSLVKMAAGERGDLPSLAQTLFRRI